MASNFKRHKQGRYNARVGELTPTPNPMPFEDPPEEEINTSVEEIVEIQRMTPQAAMFLSAANDFETALKNLKIEENNNIICKKLQRILNMTRSKIHSLKKKTETKVTDSEPEHLRSKIISTSTLSLCPVVSEKESSSRSSDLSSSKILATSTQSLCSIKSTEDENFANNEKLQIFLESVNCPFCLERKDDKKSLSKHLYESCDALRKKKFIQNKHTPYSVFQILPNSTFKCNICEHSVHRDLRHYFAHCQNTGHVFAYKRASWVKSYTNFLFCAPCKVQIPNNATQINFHIAHEAHQIRCGRTPNVNSLMRRGVVSIYLKEKKFKCINCPPKHSMFQNTKEILEHFVSEIHLKYIKRNKGENFNALNKSRVYCSFCCKEFDVFNVVSHITSQSHMLIEEKEALESSFELCLFCGFKCASLQELALHVESQCIEIDDVREGSLEKAEDRVKNSKSAPLQSGTEAIAEKKRRRHIIVQGHDSVVELFNYFNKIGEIADLDATHEKGVLIKFKEEKTVDDVLLLRYVITIDGVKVKILVEDEESVERNTKTDVLSDAVPEQKNRSESITTKEGKGTVTVPHDNIPEKSSSKVSEGFSATMDNVDIDNLIKRVSVHLENAAFKLEPNEKEKIINDCQNVLKFGKFHQVGFSICGLMFPMEEITFYCEVEGDLFKEQKSEFCLTESESFNKHMFQKCKTLLESSNFFTRVQPSLCAPACIGFRHRETERACTVTFRTSSKLLTDLLR